MLVNVSGAAPKRDNVKAERLTDSTVSGSLRSNCFPSVAGLFDLPAERCNHDVSRKQTTAIILLPAHLLLIGLSKAWSLLALQ